MASLVQLSNFVGIGDGLRYITGINQPDGMAGTGKGIDAQEIRIPSGIGRGDPCHHRPIENFIAGFHFDTEIGRVDVPNPNGCQVRRGDSAALFDDRGTHQALPLDSVFSSSCGPQATGSGFVIMGVMCIGQ